MRQPLKVWEVIPTLGGGGAEKMVLDLADGIQYEGHDVTVISLYDKSHATDNRVKFAEQHKLQIRYLDKKPGFDIHLLHELMSLIRNEKPDIIHTHIESFQYIAILSYILKFHHVHTMHSIVGRESKIYQRLLTSSSKRERTHFVVLSNNIGKAMKTTFGTRDTHLRCIPNGIDRSQYPKVERSIEKSFISFITVGSLIPVKNQGMLIRAFSKLAKERNCGDKLIILGEGELRNELTKLVESLEMNSSIVLPGNVDNVFSFLKEADVFVMSSHYEGVSLALLEAASTGLPIIATKTGGTPEVVQDDAVLIDNNDENGLSIEMKKMTNPDQRERYSIKSYRIASRFDKDNMVSAYAELYDAIMLGE